MYGQLVSEDRMDVKAYHRLFVEFARAVSEDQPAGRASPPLDRSANSRLRVGESRLEGCVRGGRKTADEIRLQPTRPRSGVIVDSWIPMFALRTSALPFGTFSVLRRPSRTG
jgi:hypothetical protein